MLLLSFSARISLTLTFKYELYSEKVHLLGHSFAFDRIPSNKQPQHVVTDRRHHEALKKRETRNKEMDARYEDTALL